MFDTDAQPRPTIDSGQKETRFGDCVKTKRPLQLKWPFGYWVQVANAWHSRGTPSTLMARVKL